MPGSHWTDMAHMSSCFFPFHTTPFLPSNFNYLIFFHYSSGDGKFISNETGITYVGSWLDGLKHGSGTLYFESGDEIVGRWNEVSINHLLYTVDWFFIA